MIELRTSLVWRIAFWIVALLQTVILSTALAAGGIAGIVVSAVFFVFFFLVALQSRSPVIVSENGIADERLLLRRAWPWGQVDEVLVRGPSMFRAGVVLRHEAGRVLPLNLRGLTATRGEVLLDREAVVRAIVDLARERRVTVRDER